MAAFHLTGATPAEVVAEQSRIDKADALVLVFPVYWWSMPGLLKGWIDRVFSNGWAYEETADGNVVKKLGAYGLSGGIRGRKPKKPTILTGLPMRITRKSCTGF
nr:NAD(P)H oxidoreductase YRKL [Raoultella sp. NCTC 9187]